MFTNVVYISEEVGEHEKGGQQSVVITPTQNWWMKR